MKSTEVFNVTDFVYPHASFPQSSFLLSACKFFADNPRLHFNIRISIETCHPVPFLQQALYFRLG